MQSPCSALPANVIGPPNRTLFLVPKHAPRPVSRWPTGPRAGRYALCSRRNSTAGRGAHSSSLTTERRRRSPHASGPTGANCPFQSAQSTATASASQICRIRPSASRPRRSTSAATETVSTESRLAAERRGIGSESGSRTTSLGSPRSVVVHGATSARRSRGIAASRDSTTTGRRPTSANAHHHTSPRAGRPFTRRPPRAATKPDHPNRRHRRLAARRRRGRQCPAQRIGAEQEVPQEPRRQARRQSNPSACGGHCPTARHPPSYSDVCDSCHDYAISDVRAARLD